MQYRLFSRGGSPGSSLPLVPRQSPLAGGFHWTSDSMANWQQMPAGTQLNAKNGQRLFVLADFCWLPCLTHSIRCPVLHSLASTGGEMELVAEKHGYSIAIITLSDKGAQGLREDSSGLLAQELTQEAVPAQFCQRFILPDKADQLRALLAHLAWDCRYDLILTSGGTGVSPGDVTPQATGRLLDLELPGLTQAMMAASLQRTPRAMLSRGLAGMIGKTLVINLPGSARAVRENLEVVLPALEHALKKINGDPADCGG